MISVGYIFFCFKLPISFSFWCSRCSWW